MKSLAENKAAVINAATDSINARMDIGAKKYDPNDWRSESVARHVHRGLKHAITALEIADGDRPDDHEDHLSAAVCRLAMALNAHRCGNISTTVYNTSPARRWYY